jgi:hypothetical protein
VPNWRRIVRVFLVPATRYEYYSTVHALIRFHVVCAVYEVLSALPKHGIGARVQRKSWHENSYWDIVRVQMDVSGKSGKSYGMLTWNGNKVDEEARRIPGSLKKVWRVRREKDALLPGWQVLDGALLESVKDDDHQGEAEKGDDSGV